MGASANDVISSIKIDQCPTWAPVTLYQDNSYSSACKSFTTNDPNLVDDKFSNGTGINDGTTAVNVPGGWFVTLFQDINYGGATRDLFAPIQLLEPAWNDQASSIKFAALNAPCDVKQPVVFYFDSNYGGGCKAFSGNDPLFSDNYMGGTAATLMDNQVSSIRVKPGWAVRLYANSNYGGSSIEYLADTPFVGAAWNDVASSATIRCVSVC